MDAPVKADFWRRNLEQLAEQLQGSEYSRWQYCRVKSWSIRNGTTLALAPS